MSAQATVPAGPTGDTPDTGSVPRGGTGEKEPGFLACVLVVARLELTQRLRASRTRWVVLAWVIAVYGFVGLTWLATRSATGQTASSIFYGVTGLVVLTLTLLVTPSLSASAISGDRADGVLATLQVSLLTPLQIATGKLLAAWAAGLGFLVVASPVLLWALATGGVGWASFAMYLLTLTLVVGTVCAIALAISSMTARVISSVVLTYLTVGFLVVGTVLIFGLTVPSTIAKEDVRVLTWDHVSGPSTSGPPPCIEVAQTREVTHTERNWWLLAFNPYVIVGDAAPGTSGPGHSPNEPLSFIQDGVRMARHGATQPLIECFAGAQWKESQRAQREARGLTTPIWPIGFATYLAVGSGAFAIAVRRLRTPVHTLPRGTRIA